jgi:hypothetical protein
LNYVSGGLYKLDVGYNCAVNEIGRDDDYCSSIKYSNSAKDVGVTPAHSTEVHDLATGNTVNAAVTGFFGTHSTPPPSGSKQVVKFAQLTESAYFANYRVTDTVRVRTWDVCVPNTRSFAKVALCGNSGTGH